MLTIQLNQCVGIDSTGWMQCDRETYKKELLGHKYYLELQTRMEKNFDPHFLIPILEFQKNDDLQLLEALSKTKMVDTRNQLYQKLKGREDPAYQKDRTQTLAELEELTQKASQVISIIEDPRVSQQLTGDKMANIQFLQSNHGYSEAMLKPLHELAMMNYQIGSYSKCAELLYHVRLLSVDKHVMLSALWGKLAAEILAQKWQNAAQDLNKLKETIDNQSFETNAHQLMQRTWLLHWSLFPFFRHAKGKEMLVDLFMQPPYLNAIQTCSPWLLKYLTVAVITASPHLIPQLVKILNVQRAEDPVSKLVKATWIEYDLNCKPLLEECADAFKQDFFIHVIWTEFLSAFRPLFLDLYSSLYTQIPVSHMTVNLSFSSDKEAEACIISTFSNLNKKIKWADDKKSVEISGKYDAPVDLLKERKALLSQRIKAFMGSLEKVLGDKFINSQQSLFFT